MCTLGTGTCNTDQYPLTVFKYFFLSQLWHRTRNEVDLPAGITNFSRSCRTRMFPLVLEPTTRTLKCVVSDNLTITFVYMLVYAVIFNDKNQQPN